jgi:SAM-dependent methyltransferase
MTATTPLDPKAAARAAWAQGDYHAFATRFTWELGPVLVQACGIRPGDRVLDVATGTGAVAVAAAEAGATVVASDLTPESLDAGRRAVRGRGLQLEWVEADAEALPFPDGSFDVVTSSLGAIFAPDHARVAGELVRVCRPGGTIGMANFTPEGRAAGFFGALAPFAPAPPPGASSPLAWGDEDHVRALLGPHCAALELTRRTYVERADDAAEYCRFVQATFGPVIAIRAGLDAARADALDRALLAFATDADAGAPGGPAAYPYEYLLVVARTTGSSAARLTGERR